MIIKTSQDAALVFCCDCLPPACEAPRKECQSLSGAADLAWEIYNSINHTYYRTTRWDYNDGGFLQWTQSQAFNAVLGGFPVSTAVRTITEGEPKTGGSNSSVSDAIDIDAARIAAIAALESAVEWDNEDFTYGTGCDSWRENRTPVSLLDQVVELSFARYRLGIPEGYSRSTYAVQWDEVFFPKPWIAWRILKDAYDAAVAEHAAWEACEIATPGECGAEPVIPADPGEPPSPAPSLVASRSWTWSGSMENPWSAWFEIPLPSSPGETRLVNMMVRCFSDSQRGVKPTAHGETHELPAAPG